MPDPSTIHNTFVIERVYPKPLDHVFSAFADANKKQRWFAEGPTHRVEEFLMNFQVGGIERLRYRFKEGSPFAETAVSNEGHFQDIVPNQRIVLSSTMTFGDKRISASLVTMEFMPADTGTDLICTHQGAFFEGSDGPQIREVGWRHLFEQLSKELTS